jgi:carbonic anhydrase
MNEDVLEAVSMLNVRFSIDKIREDSPILLEMERNNEIEIVGALYNVSTGKVEFFEG